MSDVSVLFMMVIDHPMKNYWIDSSFFNTSQEFINPCNRNLYNEAFLLKPEGSYIFRNQQTFAAKSVHTVHYGSNSSSYLGPKLFEMIPSDVKSLETVKLLSLLLKSVCQKTDAIVWWSIAANWNYFSRRFKLFSFRRTPSLFRSYWKKSTTTR